jgi:molybdopterin-binding protein
LVLHDGSHLSAVVTRDEAASLELESGQIVFARPTRETVFAERA